MKSFLYLVGGSVGLWLILLVPGWLIQGEQVWCQSLTALGLCLVPAMASLAWVWATRAKPDVQLLALLGGSGIRIGVTAAGAYVLCVFLPQLYPDGFLVWLGLIYMGVLLLEILLAVRMKPAEIAKVTASVESVK